jgi:hemerythrin-like domain-containing protein
MNEARTRAIRTIHEEHRSISAVLSGLRELARTAQDPAIRPEFAVFHAMIHYIDAFPERLHHPKEEEYLFKPLAARVLQARPLVAMLHAQHEEGARLIRDLHRSLIEFEVSWPKGGVQFLDAVNRYADFHWDHMRREERELLPFAEHYFSDEDWWRLNEAFGANEDPIRGVPEDDFRKLFTRIVNLAPDPVGLGDRWKRVAGA